LVLSWLFYCAIYFILVDAKKQIRGIYDGTNDQEVERFIKDIKILTKES
jgi:protein SCO1/2